MSWTITYNSLFSKALRIFVIHVDTLLAGSPSPAEVTLYEAQLIEVGEFLNQIRNLHTLPDPLTKLSLEKFAPNGNLLNPPLYILRVKNWTGYFDINHPMQKCVGLIAVRV